jgi:hypothetical protein
MSSLLRTKTVEQSIADTDEPGRKLRRALGPLDLTVFGVGVIIGTGIFVLTGVAAGTVAGPAVSLSFVVSGIGWPRSATRNSRRPCLSRAPRTRSPTRRSESWWRGSSAGT